MDTKVSRYIFRGKRKDNGEWVYGSLIQRRIWKSEFYVIRVTDNGFNSYEEYEVIPETIGQYTGLTDKNGTKIFEGDIVSCNSRTDCANMVVIFECGQFRMVIAEKYYNYVESCGFYDINCFEKSVIGNIHDNPELLKGE